MPEVEKWEKYGFPDPTFLTLYRPYVGLLKAINERRAAVRWGTYSQPVNLPEIPVPEYFSPLTTISIAMMQDIDSWLYDAATLFVDPEKVVPGSHYRDYFLSWDDLLLAAAGGVEEDIISTYYPYDPFTPAYPVKFAVQRYKIVNMLRYVPTVPGDYPDFECEDKYNTFNFKASEV